MMIVASSAMPRPSEARSTYFQAASVAPSVSSIATSRAEITVVISMATHSSARPFTSGATTIDQQKSVQARVEPPRVTPARGALGQMEVTDRRRSPSSRRGTSSARGTRPRASRLGAAAPRRRICGMVCGGRDQRSHEDEDGGARAIVSIREIATGVHQVTKVATSGTRADGDEHACSSLSLQPIEIFGRQGLAPSVVDPHDHAEHHDGDQQVEQKGDARRRAAGPRRRRGSPPRPRSRARRTRSPGRRRQSAR